MLSRGYVAGESGDGAEATEVEDWLIMDWDEDGWWCCC